MVCYSFWPPSGVRQRAVGWERSKTNKSIYNLLFRRSSNQVKYDWPVRCVLIDYLLQVAVILLTTWKAESASGWKVIPPLLSNCLRCCTLSEWKTLYKISVFHNHKHKFRTDFLLYIGEICLRNALLPHTFGQSLLFLLLT